MKKIGLCGGSGSGKGVVSDIIRSFSISVIDTDNIYHELTSADTDCLKALKHEFGDSITRNGALYRPALADIVFFSENAEEKRNKLNSITHGYVLQEVRKRLREYCADGADNCFIDAPLLFESGFDKECDITVAVIADNTTRIKRIMERDNIDRAAAEARIKAQLSNERLLELSDMHIENSSDISALKTAVAELINKIRE